MPVFLLTDFDRQGFTIAENLRAGTWRHRYATPPKENLAKLRTSFGLAEKPASGMPEGGVISPYLDVAAACGIRVKSEA